MTTTLDMTQLKTIAQQCLSHAEQNTQNFPQIVQTLVQAGFESYIIDFRQGRGSYFLPNGACIELTLSEHTTPISATFNVSDIQAAILEAQKQVPGYTYAGFCHKIRQAGCAGYMVSFLGQRAVYYGRTGETHLEPFPPKHD